MERHSAYPDEPFGLEIEDVRYDFDTCIMKGDIIDIKFVYMN